MRESGNMEDWVIERLGERVSAKVRECRERKSDWTKCLRKLSCSVHRALTLPLYHSLGLHHSLTLSLTLSLSLPLSQSLALSLSWTPSLSHSLGLSHSLNLSISRTRIFLLVLYRFSSSCVTTSPISEC